MTEPADTTVIVEQIPVLEQPPVSQEEIDAWKRFKDEEEFEKAAAELQGLTNA